MTAREKGIQIVILMHKGRLDMIERVSSGQAWKGQMQPADFWEKSSLGRKKALPRSCIRNPRIQQEAGDKVWEETSAESRKALEPLQGLWCFLQETDNAAGFAPGSDQT